MSETLQRNQERLENIKIIEPLLGALRTISLGAWRASLTKKSTMEAYTNNLLSILYQIMPSIKIPPVTKPVEDKARVKTNLVFVIGSDRGFCGKFDANVLDKLDSIYFELPQQDLRVWMSGSRLIRSAEQRGVEIQWAVTLTGKSYPTYSSVYNIARKILDDYEKFVLDEVNILYNHYDNAGKYHPEIVKLLPFDVEQYKNTQTASDWPDPIIETDPISIYRRIMEQLITVSLYNYFLESSASEHSARYNLMEEAGQNTDRLIEELNIIVQMGRRHAITQEMQELAAGAGLM